MPIHKPVSVPVNRLLNWRAPITGLIGSESVVPVPTGAFLLLETGDYLLLENSKMIFSESGVTAQPIISGPDDGDYDDGGGFDNTANDIDLGNDAGTAKKGFFYFASTGIPQGSEIVTAYLRVTSADDLADATVNLKFVGSDEDDAAVPANKPDAASRPRTTAVTYWNNVGAWVVDVPYDSPSIKGIIQEIVDREGFAGPILIFVEDNGSTVASKRKVHSYNGDPTKAAELVVQYWAPAEVPGLPGAPTNLFVDSLLLETARVRWHDNSDNENGFEIQRSTDGVNYAQIGTAGESVSDYIDRGLSEGTTYYYRVRAYNDAGNSAWATMAEPVELTTLVSTNGKAGTVDENQMNFSNNSITSLDISGTRYQAVAFWDEDKYLNIGWRTLPLGTWTVYVYDGSGSFPTIQTPDDDLHDIAAVGIDPDGYIHTCYAMHNDPLLYRKSDDVLGSWTGDLTAAGNMLGTNEASVTYPMFINDPLDGTLHFLFRDGIAGNGDEYMYTYNEGTTTWVAATGTGAQGKLIDGKTDSVNPYLELPVYDDDWDGLGTGYLHLTWTWRDTPDNATTHDYQYMRWDGTSWTQDSGAAQVIPATSGNSDTVIAIAAGDGLTNQNGMDVDSNGYPVIAYDLNYTLNIGYYNGAAWNTVEIWQHLDVHPTLTYPARPKVIIDRETDTAYALFKRDVHDGLWYCRSDPGDFSTWSEAFRFYWQDVEFQEPQYDRNEWKDEGQAHCMIVPWGSGGGAQDVIVLIVGEWGWTPN